MPAARRTPDERGYLAIADADVVDLAQRIRAHVMTDA